MLDAGLVVLLLIFIRMTGFFAVVPFFTLRGVPALTKIGLAGVMAYLIFQTMDFEALNLLPGIAGMFIMTGREALVGLTLGFSVFLIFGGIRIAGQFIDLQMGLLMANVFDPQFGSPVTLVGQLYYYLGLIYFFIINGHHSMLAALTGSYQVIPPGMGVLGEVTLWKVMDIFFWMFLLAFQIALPVVVTLLMVDISLGLISKTVPQLHVFIVGLPLKIGLGMAALVLVIPMMTVVFENIFSQMVRDMFSLMETFQQ